MAAGRASDLDYAVVLGCPRSGTTFLMDVLDTLPDTEAIAGNLVPIYVPHALNLDLPREIRNAMVTGFDTALDIYLQSGMHLSRSVALRKWNVVGRNLRDLPAALRGERTVDRIVYKEPFLAFAPELAWEALPEVRIVHLFRDGRDCANSLVRSYDVLTDEKLSDLRSSEAPLGRRHRDVYVPWWVEEGDEDLFLDSSPYVRAIWMWKAMVRRCRDFFDRPEVRESGRGLEVRYEDLSREPLGVGHRIAEHLGVTPTRAFDRRLQGATDASIGKHRNRDPAEIAEAERIAGRELSMLGYAVGIPQERDRQLVR
jgi:hypothetical protein